MNRKLSKLVGSLLFVLGILLVVQPARVLGHNGGEPRLVDVQAGDFRLSVWTLPVPLVTGEQNFIVFVAESAEDDENSFVRANTPVLDANIELTLIRDNGGESLTVSPDHERATNKLFYETYFELEEAGSYTGIVSVEHNGKMGEAGFSFEVAQGLIEINWFRYSGFAVLLVAVGWFIWQMRLDNEEDVA
ncbi:MAG: hypothetical protein AB8G95_06885 [Anaerolineae bacterium]